MPASLSTQVDRSFVKRDDEVRAGDGQAARRRNGRRIDSQPIQPFNRRQPLRRGDAPGVRAAAVRPPDVEQRRDDPRTPRRLGKHLDDDAVPVVGKRVFERHAVAFVDDHAKRAGDEEIRRELLDLAGIRGAVDERRESGDGRPAAAGPRDDRAGARRRQARRPSARTGLAAADAWGRRDSPRRARTRPGGRAGDPCQLTRIDAIATGDPFI